MKLRLIKLLTLVLACFCLSTTNAFADECEAKIFSDIQSNVTGENSASITVVKPLGFEGHIPLSYTLSKIDCVGFNQGLYDLLISLGVDPITADIIAGMGSTPPQVFNQGLYDALLPHMTQQQANAITLEHGSCDAPSCEYTNIPLMGIPVVIPPGDTINYSINFEINEPGEYAFRVYNGSCFGGEYVNERKFVIKSEPTVVCPHESNITGTELSLTCLDQRLYFGVITNGQFCPQDEITTQIFRQTPSGDWAVIYEINHVLNDDVTNSSVFYHNGYMTTTGYDEGNYYVHVVLNGQVVQISDVVPYAGCFCELKVDGAIQMNLHNDDPCVEECTIDIEFEADEENPLVFECDEYAELTTIVISEAPMGALGQWQVVDIYSHTVEFEDGIAPEWHLDIQYKLGYETRVEIFDLSGNLLSVNSIQVPCDNPCDNSLYAASNCEYNESEIYVGAEVCEGTYLVTATSHTTGITQALDTITAPLNISKYYQVASDLYDVKLEKLDDPTDFLVWVELVVENCEDDCTVTAQGGCNDTQFEEESVVFIQLESCEGFKDYFITRRRIGQAVANVLSTQALNSNYAMIFPTPPGDWMFTFEDPQTGEVQEVQVSVPECGLNGCQAITDITNVNVGPITCNYDGNPIIDYEVTIAAPCLGDVVLIELTHYADTEASESIIDTFMVSVGAFEDDNTFDSYFVSTGTNAGLYEVTASVLNFPTETESDNSGEFEGCQTIEEFVEGDVVNCQGSYEAYGTGLFQVYSASGGVIAKMIHEQQITNEFISGTFVVDTPGYTVMRLLKQDEEGPVPNHLKKGFNTQGCGPQGMVGGSQGEVIELRTNSKGLDVPMHDEKIVYIHPNPASTIVNIQTNSDAIITITDMAGKPMMPARRSGAVNIANLPNGMYLIHTNAGEEPAKFVKH